MRIGIDAFSAVGSSGNSTYSKQLIRHLLLQEDSHRYYLFEYLHDLLRPIFNEKGARNYTEVHMQLSASYFWLPRLEYINKILLYTAARLHRIDLFHFTNPLNYIDGPFKKIVTVHDLAPLHDPSWSKEHAGRLFKEKLAQVVSADAIIAVSEFTRQDLVERLKVDSKKITVVYEGAGEEFFPDNDPEATRAITGTDTYLLCVGQLQPRKNNLNLIRAFGIIAPHFPQLKLVFVGRSASEEYLGLLHNVVKEVGVEDSVIFAHAVDNAGLRKLYTRAECLVYPSLFEGFGLPLLEAFQCGTPVITSRTSSLPEVAGGAGLLVDPHSIEAIAEAMRQFLSNSDIRQKLRAAIPKQLQMFSWEKAARETLNVYASLA
jgi:glycosyltransferase involved in cell wall biosynthesis